MELWKIQQEFMFFLFICRFSFEENSEMTGSPELSMVLEKAIVLLNGNEFSALRRILAEYEATEINIDTFADSLLQLIKDQEKVGWSRYLLTENLYVQLIGIRYLPYL